MVGPGFIDDTYMDAAALDDTWYPLVVTGTANYSGICEIWVSVGTNKHSGTTTSFPNNYSSPPSPTVPADWDTMFEVAVYVDGLQVTVS